MLPVEQLPTSDVGGVAIDQQTLPAMLDDQVCRIALDAIAGADLDDPAVGSADDGEEVPENPVFAVLRMAAELDLGEVWRRQATSLLVLVLEAELQLGDLRRRGRFVPPMQGARASLRRGCFDAETQELAGGISELLAHDSGLRG
jgi:hypothetical protein